MSSVDPNLTFLKFMDERDLPADFVEDVRRYKFRGSSGKVNLALDALPNFTCLPGPGPHLRGAISISPSVDYMERAYDDAKYGRFSRRPYIDIVIPSLTDPSVAPPGKHVMSCFVQYAPYHSEGRRSWDDAARGVWRRGDRHHRRVRAEHPGHHPAPAGADAARHRTRLRAHRRQHLPGRADARAVVLPAAGAGWAQYSTPIDRLYMCGSATHPGGGIMGAPGRNAAERILRTSMTHDSRFARTRVAQDERPVALRRDRDRRRRQWPDVRGLLAKSGVRTLLLEQRDALGGCAAESDDRAAASTCRRSRTPRVRSAATWSKNCSSIYTALPSTIRRSRSARSRPTGGRW